MQKESHQDEEDQIKKQSPPRIQAKPLLYVDIDIGDGEKDRITVMKDDDPDQLAS